MLRCEANSLSTQGIAPDLREMTTMTLRTSALAALVSITLVGGALAEDRIDLTPPLYRD